MKPITLPGIETYAELHTSREPASLAAVAEATRRSFEAPQMMVGPVAGHFLQMLVYALRPRLVLEIGTFTGYSSLAMAAALPPGGRIVTCEADPAHAAAAQRHVDASAYRDRIEIVVGPALESVERLDGPFDFVFVDADKARYLDYLEAVLPKLGEPGLVAADNTLWNGDVLSPDGDPDARALQHFNDTVAADPRLVCVLLTVRDGVTLIRRTP